MLYLLEMQTPVGDITVVSDEHYIIRLDFGKKKPEDYVNILTNEETFCFDLTRPAVLTEAQKQLNEYFARKRTSFDLPLKLQGTDFQRQCWNALTEIPYGTTISYKELAEHVGRPKAFRAVGQSNHRNPIAIILPCHRVIASNGSLCGFGGGLDVKEKLLTLEHKDPSSGKHNG